MVLQVQHPVVPAVLDHLLLEAHLPMPGLDVCEQVVYHFRVPDFVVVRLAGQPFAQRIPIVGVLDPLLLESG